MTLLKRTFNRPSVFILFQGSRGILGPSGPAGTDGASVSIELRVLRTICLNFLDFVGFLLRRILESATPRHKLEVVNVLLRGHMTRK